jgi:dolichyl-phosphate-mannose-protein mannosyltransferase
MPSFLRRLNRPVVAVIAVAAIAAGIRLWGLSRPTGLVFDEVYYAKSGCLLIGGTDDVCRVTSSDEHFWVKNKWDMGSWVHPPLGKWMTAMGIKAFGMDAFGWRVPSMLAGTLMAVMVAIMAQLLFGRPIWTFVAGGLIAIDGLNIVMSRVAMLDVFLAFWVTLGFLCLLLDRRWIDRRTAPIDEARFDPTPELDPGDVGGDVLDGDPGDPGEQVSHRHGPRVPSPLWRPWRFASGMAVGAACAVKWSGLTALAAVVLLSIIWETVRRHRGDLSWPRSFGRMVAMETFGMVLAFLLIPVLVYTVTWLPWLNHFGWDVQALVDNHLAMWRYHRDLSAVAYDSKSKTFTPTHGYYSQAWTWLVVRRPVNFYVKDLGPDIRQILTIGNLALFWGTIWTIPYAVWAWVRRRDWRAGFLVVSFAVQWLPWFAVSRPQFFFYVLPLTPVMALAAIYTLHDLSDARLVLREHTGEISTDPDTGHPAVSSRHPFRPVVWGYLAVAVALFVWFWPLLVGSRISDAWWRIHIWMPTWN